MEPAEEKPDATNRSAVDGCGAVKAQRRQASAVGAASMSGTPCTAGATSPAVAKGPAWAQHTMRKGAGPRPSLPEVLVEVQQHTNLSWLMGRIIGRDGMNVRNIREETGVHVVVETNTDVPSGKNRLIAHLMAAAAGADSSQALHLLKEYVLTAVAEERSFQQGRVLRRRTLRRKRTSDIACFIEAEDIQDLSWFKGRLIGKQGINLQSIAWETGVKFDLVESSTGRRGLEARFKSRERASCTASSVKTAVGMLENLASKARQEEAAWRRRNEPVRELTERSVLFEARHLTADAAAFPALSVSDVAAREPASPCGWNEMKMGQGSPADAEGSTSCDASEQTEEASEGGYRMWLHLDRAVPNHLRFLIQTQREVDLACFMKRIAGRDMCNLKRISDATDVRIHMRELAESATKPAALQITIDWERENALTSNAIEMLKDAVAKSWSQLAPGRPGWRMPVTSTERDRQWSLHQAEDRRQLMERTKCNWLGSDDAISLERMPSMFNDVPSMFSDHDSDYTSDEDDSHFLNCKGKDEDEYDASSEADVLVKEHSGLACKAWSCGLKTLAQANDTAQCDTVANEPAEQSLRIIHQRVIRSEPGFRLLPPWLQRHAPSRLPRTCKVFEQNEVDSSPTGIESEVSLTSPAECVREPNVMDGFCAGVEVASTEASEGEESEDFSHCGDTCCRTSSCMSFQIPEPGEQQTALAPPGKHCNVSHETEEQQDVPSGNEGSVVSAGNGAVWQPQPNADFGDMHPQQTQCQTGEGWMVNTFAWQLVPVIPVLYFVTPVFDFPSSDAQPFQPATTAAPAVLPLEQYACPKCNAISVKWRLNAKDLRGKNNRSPTRLLSPSFDLSFGDSAERVPFKLMILPKGAPSFQRAKDRVSVHLKCEAEEAQLPAHASHTCLCFRVAASSRRGPFEHNFTRHAVFSLPKGQEAWDLRAEGSCFLVHLDVLQHAKPPSHVNFPVDDTACVGCFAANEGAEQT